jgi:hypothetical protein
MHKHKRLPHDLAHSERHVKFCCRRWALPSMAAPTTISRNAVLCLDSFRTVQLNLHSRAGDPHARLSAKTAEELARFKVWIGDAGIEPRGSPSLEFRLRDASHLRHEANSLLFQLNIALNDGNTPDATRTLYTAIGKLIVIFFPAKPTRLSLGHGSHGMRSLPMSFLPGKMPEEYSAQAISSLIRSSTRYTQISEKPSPACYVCHHLSSTRRRMTCWSCRLALETLLHTIPHTPSAFAKGFAGLTARLPPV